MALEGIAGRIALVTGAARRRGIGRAVALRLAREGADVACLDIARPYADFPGYGVAGGDELDEVVREIEALGRRALALRADVSSWDDVHAAVARAHDALGSVDLCCNVAGGAGMGMGGGALAPDRGEGVGPGARRQSQGDVDGRAGSRAASNAGSRARSRCAGWRPPTRSPPRSRFSAATTRPTSPARRSTSAAARRWCRRTARHR